MVSDGHNCSERLLSQVQVRAAEQIKQTHLPESIWKGLPSFINLSFSIVKVGAAAALAAAHRQESPRSRGDMVDY